MTFGLSKTIIYKKKNIYRNSKPSNFLRSNLSSTKKKPLILLCSPGGRRPLGVVAGSFSLCFYCVSLFISVVYLSFGWGWAWSICLRFRSSGSWLRSGGPWWFAVRLEDGLPFYCGVSSLGRDLCSVTFSLSLTKFFELVARESWDKLVRYFRCGAWLLAS